MWLVNCNTLKLEQFFGSNIPSYAILSHTWEEEEVTFDELGQASTGYPSKEQSIHVKERQGYSKIYETCLLAKEDGLDYAWIDTCCINKSSSAELTESINSMFQWYQNAARCFVFLSDLHEKTPTEKGLVACKWFTRGWTLQELIAPKEVFFYDQTWKYRGTRTKFSDTISSITNINGNALLGRSPMAYSVATRMSWAAHRQTTRTEDLAYCLLGIFEVNMPMIYGEGPNAFLRLQEEIVKRSNDMTIFAWDQKQEEGSRIGLFALSPAGFARSKDIAPISRAWLDPVFAMTNKGLKIDNFKLLWKKTIDDGNGGLETTYSIPLGSSYVDDVHVWIAMPIRKIGPDVFVRSGRLLTTTWTSARRAAVSFYLHAATINPHIFEALRRQEAVHFPKHKFQIEEVIPESHWDDANSLFFHPLDDFSLVLAAQCNVVVRGSTIQFVVCILYPSPGHPKCLVFSTNGHHRLSSWLFRHKRLGHDVTWEDVKADEPETPGILNCTHQLETVLDETKFRISISTDKGVVSPISDQEIYSVNYGVETIPHLKRKSVGKSSDKNLTSKAFRERRGRDVSSDTASSSSSN
ncbi:hypothetical protein EG329_013975 [Mollisiaceae sp. DMI_Dod_QoI]|nr:hypothetical protein EG329_013975 [Helotiales sp. DMI_Dod_QoI]